MTVVPRPRKRVPRIFQISLSSSIGRNLNKVGSSFLVIFQNTRLVFFLVHLILCIMNTYPLQTQCVRILPLLVDTYFRHRYTEREHFHTLL